MLHIIKRLLIAVLFLNGLLFCRGIYAETLDVAYPHDDAQFTAVLESASNGDIIQFPAISSNWAAPVAINKNVVIKGAGIGHTILNGSQFFTFDGEAGSGTRITGIEFNGGQPAIFFSERQSAKDIRIDNCKFTDCYGAIRTDGIVRGVVDHCIFSNSYAFYLFADSYSTQNYPLDVGNEQTSSSNVLYIEDNLFTNVKDCSTVKHSIVGNSAARAVIRYNVFDYQSGSCGWADAIDAHDSNENWPERGTLGYEIYENQFLMADNNGRIFHLRGGHHIVFNNHFNANLTHPISITSYTYFGAPQRCEGNEWDPDDVTPTSCPDQINHSYFWGNKMGCGDDDLKSCTNGTITPPRNNAPGVIALNKHYYTSEMGDYSPYTYPHPLVSQGGGESPPDPPRNLEVVGGAH